MLTDNRQQALVIQFSWDGIWGGAQYKIIKLRMHGIYHHLVSVDVFLWW